MSGLSRLGVVPRAAVPLGAQEILAQLFELGVQGMFVLRRGRYAPLVLSRSDISLRRLVFHVAPSIADSCGRLLRPGRNRQQRRREN